MGVAAAAAGADVVLLPLLRVSFPCLLLLRRAPKEAKGEGGAGVVPVRGGAQKRKTRNL